MQGRGQGFAVYGGVAEIDMDEGGDDRTAHFLVKLMGFADNLSVIKKTNMINCGWLEGLLGLFIYPVGDSSI